MSKRKSTSKGPPPKRRKGRELEPSETILILCEGKQTEPNYFRSLRKAIRGNKRFSVTVMGIGKDLETVIERAIKEKKKELFDEIWVVADIENKQEQKSVKDAIRSVEKKVIALSLSNPCFEVWVLAHYERPTKFCANCDRVIRLIRQNHLPDYDKTDENLYETLASRTDTAITNTQEGIAEVKRNTGDATVATWKLSPSTEVYKLVGRLLGKDSSN